MGGEQGAELSRFEVTFVKPGGEIHTCAVPGNYHHIVEQARALRAPFVVFCEGDNLWEVFDIRKADKVANQWSMPLPIRQIVAETNDAAVMWAVHQGRK